MERWRGEATGKGNRNTAAMHAARHQQARIEEDDSADEAEMISTRTLAQTRYRRNHEFMNEVFMHAAFGDLKQAPPPKPLSVLFKKEDLETQVTKLSAEIEELQAKAKARREARATENLADISMDVYGSEGIVA
ncbi:hypothetical protein NLI96_g9495 [Meripilus lineatus]|uniref:Uncharacterized protein n=1 Tax=Meripilus lineatus TaxID=2056292 RepID=A0AAD5YA52_9APHY|nr:hypothetical protein NLI96_g9495 [Physisporinus lineatus]